MQTTEYSWMTSEELILTVANKDNPTSLELELSQRLAVALDELGKSGDDA